MTIKVLYKDQETVTITDLIQEIKNSQNINQCGAIFTFEGIVRGQEDELEVYNLDLSTPDLDKTQKELETIIQDIKDKYQVVEISVVHYLGSFKPGDSLFLTAVAGAHRQESRDALREVIERVKYELDFEKLEESNTGNKTIMSGG